MSRMLWRGVGLRFKLSNTRNGPVLDEIRGILVHQQHNQTGVVNKYKKRPYLRHRCRKYLIYDTAERSRDGPRIG